MKAIIIEKPGPSAVLQVKDLQKPVAQNGEVLIRVHAAGINRPDVAQRLGLYPPPPHAPQHIPGLEVAGTVEHCGEGVTRWQPGAEVCALLPGGGYAEYVVSPEGHCLPVPAGLSFVEAASLPETTFTVWHNVFERGRLQPGENLLVHGGSSGIGITAIQMAKAFGAQVATTAGSAKKCSACIDLGAAMAINYTKVDFEEVMAAGSIDVIVDMVGGEYIPKNLRLLAVDGRLVFINAMQGAAGQFNVMDIMRRRLTITGSTLRNREDSFKARLATAVEQNVWPMIAAGTFKPVIYKTFPLNQAAKAHKLMESSKHIGKIVLTVDGEW